MGPRGRDARGIRIEDNVLITEAGYEVITGDVPLLAEPAAASQVPLATARSARLRGAAALLVGE